jgi:hypothetical protein
MYFGSAFGQCVGGLALFGFTSAMQVDSWFQVHAKRANRSFLPLLFLPVTPCVQQSLSPGACPVIAQLPV